MTTRIASGGPATYVATVPTAARTTAPPSRPFEQVISASVSAIVRGAEQAATHLPGGPILAAAMRSAPSGVAPSAAHSPEGASSAAGLNTGAAGTNPLSAAGGATGIEGTLSQGADQNLYFLELQERISQESRSYTALSNVLKARHETVKNAIGNIR